MAERLCHCFGHTTADIASDLRQNGQSTILARILAAKKRGDCTCALKNPTGR